MMSYEMLRVGTGPRCVSAPGRLIIWRPLKPVLLKSFRSRLGLVEFLRAHAQTADLFSESLSRIDTRFYLCHITHLFKWRLSASYGLASGVAVRLSRPLCGPCYQYEKTRC